MLKRDEINDPLSCLNRAEDHEPLFVLRAHDKLSPSVVAYWAELAKGTGTHANDKVVDALACAENMLTWRREHQ